MGLVDQKLKELSQALDDEIESKVRSHLYGESYSFDKRFVIRVIKKNAITNYLESVGLDENGDFVFKTTICVSDAMIFGNLSSAIKMRYMIEKKSSKWSRLSFVIAEERAL